MPVVVIVVLGGRWIPLDAAGPAVLPILFVHLGGLGVELGSHDAQAFGAREVETGSSLLTTGRRGATLIGLKVIEFQRRKSHD